MTPNRFRSFVVAAAAALALTSCGSRSTWPAGTYNLDISAFADHGARVLIDAGQVPPEFEDKARDLLKQVTFDLELESGGEWTCYMGTPEESHDYKGTWKLDGENFSMHQTHEDGNPKTDSMSGTLVGNVMTLNHNENGLKMLYTLRRQGATPASPK